MTDSRTVHMPDGRPTPEVMKPADVVEFLQITTENPTATVRRLKKHGLRTAKIANEVRCLLDDVLAFAESQVETNDGSEASNSKKTKQAKEGQSE